MPDDDKVSSSEDQKIIAKDLAQWIRKLKLSELTEIEDFENLDISDGDNTFVREDNIDDSENINKDKRVVEGFLEAGILHGFVRYFDKKGRLSFVGKHENGQPCGTCWKIIPGGGCVVGEVDSDGFLTGADIAYIYPDFATVLLGQFRDGVMEKAQEAFIVGMEENDNGIKVPTYSSPKGHMHVRQIRTFNHICSDPLAPDPYESKFVNVCSSGILGAEEGLFAKVDIAVNTTVAFYNGARVESKDVDVDNWETNNYRIFDPEDIPDGAIDIPVWAQSCTAYCATLAHKINHSFLLNTQFVVFDHPKYGLVPCMVAIADIQQGEEILVGYGYQLEASPDWYQLDWKNSPYGQLGMDHNDWMESRVIEEYAFKQDTK